MKTWENKIQSLKLRIGEIMKYKELIQILEIENKRSGNSRNAQYRELRQYIDLEDLNRGKIVIHDIYDIPKLKEDKRIQGDRSIYGNHIRKLLLDLLSRQEGKNICLSMTGILRKLEMINYNYDKYKYNFKSLSNLLRVSTFSVEESYNISYNSMKASVINVLEKLRKESLINWSHTYTVVFKDEGNTFRMANEEEENAIRDIERKVKNQMSKDFKREINTNQDVFLSGLWEHFKKERNRELYEYFKKQDASITVDFYYESFNIRFSKEFILCELLKNTYELPEDDRIRVRKELNSIQGKQYIKNVTKRQEDALKRELPKNPFKGSKEKGIFSNLRCSKNYVGNCSKTIKTIINH